LNKGFYLSLLMGKFNADPVPQALIDALTEVQVVSSVGAQSGFEIKFTVGKSSAINRSLLPSGFFEPRTRVIIATTVNGVTDVIMDGIITQQSLAPSSDPGKTVLSITGLDLTALMDFIELTGIPYPAMPMFAIVDLILAKYAVFGVIPLVIPNILSLIANPIERFRKQKGTDYQYVSGLASQYGHVFYLDPGPTPGTSIAYWGPDVSTFASPQPPLTINTDAETNVESLSFSYDGLMPRQYIVTILEPNSGIPIPIPVPNIDLLKAPMAKRAPTPIKSEILTNVANKSPVEAALLALGALVKSSDCITGTGSLDVNRFGHVLKARRKAQVRGAGLEYDGLYYVKSVTHSIKRGEYKQSFSMMRGGVGSSIDRVSV
jgi:hypothetical protein